MAVRHLALNADLNYGKKAIKLALGDLTEGTFDSPLGKVKEAVSKSLYNVGELHEQAVASEEATSQDDTKFVVADAGDTNSMLESGELVSDEETTAPPVAHSESLANMVEKKDSSVPDDAADDIELPELVANDKKVEGNGNGDDDSQSPVTIEVKKTDASEIALLGSAVNFAIKSDALHGGPDRASAFTAIQAQLPKYPMVTMETQNSEQIPLWKLKNPKLLPIYLGVSDEDWESVTDRDKVAEMKFFCETNAGKDFRNVDRIILDQQLKAAVVLSFYVTALFDFAEYTTLGIIAKNRIRQGIYFGIIQKMVKQLKLKWEEFFRENFNPKTFTAINEAIWIARIPNIIGYSFLGWERMKRLKSAFKEKYKDGLHPVMQCLSAIQQFHNFENEDSLQNFIDEVDAVIGIAEIKKAEKEEGLQLGVPDALVLNLVSHGIKINDTLIDRMFQTKETNGDMNLLLDRTIINNGQSQSRRHKATKKALTIQKATGYLGAYIQYIKDNNCSDEIPEDGFSLLEQQVIEIGILKASNQ